MIGTIGYLFVVFRFLITVVCSNSFNCKLAWFCNCPYHFFYCDFSL